MDQGGEEAEKGHTAQKQQQIDSISYFIQTLFSLV